MCIRDRACVAQEYPLYYDAVNEKGLGMAGLNFVGNACYAASPAKGKDNIAVFEFIPWVLGQCATVKEAGALLAKANLVGLPFNEQMPAAQLHCCLLYTSMEVFMHCCTG